MPVIVKMEFEDGTDSVARFPAEIWRFNDQNINKVISTKKKVVQWTLDPYFETGRHRHFGQFVPTCSQADAFSNL